MLPKRKTTPRGSTQRQLATARSRVVREARVARDARRAKVQESIHEVGQEDEETNVDIPGKDENEVDQKEPRVNLAVAAARPLFTDDLLAVSTGVMQMQ